MPVYAAFRNETAYGSTSFAVRPILMPSSFLGLLSKLGSMRKLRHALSARPFADSLQFFPALLPSATSVTAEFLLIAPALAHASSQLSCHNRELENPRERQLRHSARSAPAAAMGISTQPKQESPPRRQSCSAIARSQRPGSGAADPRRRWCQTRIKWLKTGLGVRARCPARPRISRRDQG